MTGEVPPPLKKQGWLAISTLDLREIGILAVFLGLALVILFSLPGALALRIFLASLLAGSGLALAFTTLQGEKPEAWLYHSLAFRLSGRKLSVWRRGDEAAPRSAPLEAETPPAPVQTPAPSRRPAVRPDLAGDRSFLSAMANVTIFAILASLTAYMATGGAQQVVDYARYIMR